MSLAYACNCLNVRLHVASTIDASSSLTDELGSELMGWKLSLGVGGIVIVSGVAWLAVCGVVTFVIVTRLLCFDRNKNLWFDCDKYHMHRRGQRCLASSAAPRISFRSYSTIRLRAWITPTGIPCLYPKTTVSSYMKV